MLIFQSRSNAAVAKDARAKRAARRKGSSKRETSINPVVASAEIAHKVQCVTKLFVLRKNKSK
jgi:hypothetical protein